MMTKTRLAVAMIAAAAPFAFAAPAHAGGCPAGQAGANPLTGAPTAPKDVTDDVLGSVDLESEIGVADRDLRLRKLVIQPGGIVPLHTHAGRPALIITIAGEIVEYRSTCKVGIPHPKGDVSTEENGLSHWWRNEGTVPAVLLAADVKKRD